MFHKISSNHIIFRSDAFQKDAIAFNLMTTILSDTSRYPDTKCSTVVEYDLKNAKNKEHFVHKIHGIGGTDKKPIH